MDFTCLFNHNFKLSELSEDIINKYEPSLKTKTIEKVEKNEEDDFTDDDIDFAMNIIDDIEIN